jgi:hypothetical protein
MRRRRGRPPIENFLQDPDRYLLAVAAAFPDLGTTRRGAVEIAVAAIEGYPVGPNLKPGWGRGLGLLYEEFTMRREPGMAATIPNRARELRRKMKRAAKDPVAARWIAVMSQAAALALWAAVPPPGGKTAGELIIELARLVGEEAFATQTLIEIWRGVGIQRISAAAAASVADQQRRRVPRV